MCLRCDNFYCGESYLIDMIHHSKIVTSCTHLLFKTKDGTYVLQKTSRTQGHKFEKVPLLHQSQYYSTQQVLLFTQKKNKSKYHAFAAKPGYITWLVKAVA